MKPGYKQTEVGVIPEDWDVSGLGRYWTVTDCKHVTADFVANGYPLASIREVQSRYVNLSEANQTTPNFYGQLIEGGRKPRAGDLILSRNATVGEVAQVADWHPPFAMGQDVCLLRKKSSANSTDFLQSLFASPVIEQQFADMMVGSTFKRANVEQIRNLTVPMPNPDEQKAIAEALSEADALIESLAQLLAKKRDLKQGAMQELLHPKPDWNTAALEEIAEVIDPHPSHRAPPEVAHGIPFVGIGDLSEEGELIGRKIRRVDPTVFDEHRMRYDMNEELIGLGRVASIGKVVRIKAEGFKYTISPTLGLIRGTKVARSYLLYALKSKSVVDQFNRIMSGSTRSSVGMIVLRRLTISFPSTTEQQEQIAATLSDMDAEIINIESRLAKARKLKQGMMQELLTGRIRLI